MTEEIEWKSLCTLDKIEHKQWKARVEGFEEAIKLFQTQVSSKSNVFNDYVGLMKKLVCESNAIAQEKALDAVISYLQNASVATRVASEVCSSVVAKCLNSVRSKTKEKGIEILMLYIELEKQDIVMEEVVKGLSFKQPKIVIGCIQTLREALSSFGSKVVSIKLILKETIKLIEDRDSNIRKESKDLIVEMFRWAGAAIKPQLTGLKPVMLSELETEFSNIQNCKPNCTRYLKSQKPKEVPRDIGDTKSENYSEKNTESEPVTDAYDLSDPVDILSNIPQEFWTQIEEKKWQERKQALEIIESRSNVVKLESGDYSELVKALLKVIAKDTNVLLVGLSAKILTQIATALRKKFQNYAVNTIQTCIEKFKERKPTILTSLRAVVDAAKSSIPIDSIQDDLIAALSNKNPGIRTETALFISRIFSKMTITTLNKKILKTFVAPLTKCSADTVLEVREASFFALGTAMFVVTEKNITPFLSDLDNIRLSRVKEFFEKVSTEHASIGNTNEAVKPTTVESTTGGAPGRQAFKVVKTKRPPLDGKLPTNEASKTKAGTAGSKKKGAVSPDPMGLPKETLISDDLIASQITEAFGEDLLVQLASNVWKERLEAIETLASKCRAIPSDELSCQLVCRFIMRKPGLKDNNFQVLRLKFELISEVLRMKKVCSEMYIDLLLPDLLEKIGDIKASESVKVALTALSETTLFELVGDKVIKAAFQLKNPKSQVEALNWLSVAIKEFGFKLNSKELVGFLKTGFCATNLQVRQACILLSSSMYLFMGPTLRTLLSDEKPALITMLEEEWAKIGDIKPPPPTRGIRVIKQQSVTEKEEQPVVPVTPDPEDLIPRTDISEKLTDDIFELLLSKAWKERQEGLDKIQQVLTAAPFIEGGQKLQEPLGAIAKVCSDVNKIIAKNALGIVENFAKALPKTEAKKLVKYIQPAVLNCFGDSKPNVREAAVSALTAWRDRVGFASLSENDMLSEALKPENPYLRSELVGWLATSMSEMRVGKPPASTLTSEFREQLTQSIFPICEDRNQDARGRAHKMLNILIRAFGYDVMLKCLKRLKISSKEAITPLLEKAREQVSTEDAELNKNAAEVVVSAPKSIRGGGAFKTPTPEENTHTPDDDDELTRTETSPTTNTNTSDPPKKIVSKKQSMTSKKAAALVQAEEAAAVLPLQANKLRETRIQDEKKRKLIKWDFDAPSREHVLQLDQLFLAAGASPELHSNLFHTDFKKHIKAIDILGKLFDNAWPSVDGFTATLANLDLILRWIVLRFFETSPAVLSRSLEYVLKVFTRMEENQKNLSDYEAVAFLPYLVMKVGDPKDNIRKEIRSIFKVVALIHPSAKLFTFLINGLKSKVNRARQECLEEIACLIERFGLNVCQPSPTVSLKILASQIKDRDSGVRTAALNSLVTAYAIVGESIWKMIGDLAEKDRSMLEERIKRSGRPQTSVSTTSSSKRSASEQPPGTREPTDRQKTIHTQPRINPMQPQSINSIAYAKALNQLAELGDLNPEMAADIPNLLQLDNDINEIFKPLDIPQLKSRAPQPVLNVLLRTSPDAASAITMVVTQISSNDLSNCCYALTQIDALLQSDKWQFLQGHINQIIMLITIQLRQTNSRFFDDPAISPDTLMTTLKCILVTVDSIFKRPHLAREGSRESLKEFFFSVLHLMVHEKTPELPEGGGIIRLINCLILQIIEQANITRVLSAFIHLLHDSVSTGHFTNRFTQVVMRGLWRITKSLDTTANSFSLDLIFIDCHQFLKAFPSASWKTRKSDVPLRTIKTLLHTFCQLRGPSVLKYTEALPNREESELETYLKRTLKTMSNSKDNPKVNVGLKNAPPTAKVHTLNSANQEKLNRLLKSIADSNESEAIQKLFDFTQTFPGLDLEPYLASFTPFFQQYVRQALSNIAFRRVGNNGIGDHPNGSTQQTSTEDSSAQPTNPKMFLERLASLRKEIGLDPNNAASGEFSNEDIEGRLSEGALVNNSVLQTTLRNMVNPSMENGTSNDPPESRKMDITAEELIDYKRRLALIKAAQSRS